MNKVSNAPSMQDVCSICASPMRASIDYSRVCKFDCATEQVNATLGFSLSNNSYSNAYNLRRRNHPNFSWKSENVENPQAQSSILTPPCFRNQRYAPPTSHQAPSGSSDIDKLISALGTLTFVIQNADSKVQSIKSKMHVVDSHSQSIAKLETQVGWLAIALGKRKDGKLPSHSIQNSKG